MSRTILYKAVKNRLKSVMPELCFIDLQKGQFKKQSENYPIPLPAALIGFSRIDYKTMLQRESHGKVTVKVSLYVDNSADSFDGAEQEEQSIAMLDLNDKIFQTLEGLNDDKHFQALLRTAEDDEMIGRVLCFNTYFDTKLLATKKDQKVEVAVNLNVKAI